MNKVLIISLSLLLFSCKEEVVERTVPDNLLTSEQMIAILTDLSISEAAYQMKYVQVSRYSKLMQESADSIFELHKTNRKHYELSFDYYVSDQEEMIRIYQAVKVNIEKMKTELPEESLQESVGNAINPVPANENSTGHYRTEEDLPR